MSHSENIAQDLGILSRTGLCRLASSPLKLLPHSATSQQHSHHGLSDLNDEGQNTSTLKYEQPWNTIPQTSHSGFCQRTNNTINIVKV